MRRSIVAVGMLFCLAAWLPHVAAQGQALQIKVLDPVTKGDRVTVAFQVKDENGKDVLNLKSQNVSIIENGPDSQPISIEDDQFVIQNTDDRKPVIEYAASDGKQQKFVATSATIGVVFAAIDRPYSTGSDTLAVSRDTVKYFLCEDGDCVNHPRTLVADNPEALSLFIPTIQSGGQISQPREFKDFPQELQSRLDITEYLKQIKRKAPITLYATLKTAIEATANKAEQRGGPAAIMLVSNLTDDDALLDTQLQELVKLVQQRHVQIIALRSGSGAKVDAQFQALAGETGLFQAAQDDLPAYLDAVSKSFGEMITLAPTGLYTASYVTKLIPDGQVNHLQVVIKQGDSSVMSAPKEFVVKGLAAPLTPLSSVLLSTYFPPAVAVALLLALLIVLLTGASRWNRSRSVGISR